MKLRLTAVLVLSLYMCIATHLQDAIAAAAFTPFYETFDYKDGWIPSANDGWTVSKPQDAGNAVQAKDNTLMVTTTGSGQVSFTKKLPAPFTGEKAIVRFSVKIVKNTEYNLCFPAILPDTGTTDATTQLLQVGNKLTYIDAVQGNKDIDIKLQEGHTYSFGFIIDLKNQTEDTYIKDMDGTTASLKGRGLKTKGIKQISAITFWLGNNNGKPGEFYFDNISVEEATGDAIKKLENDLVKRANVKIDSLDDIKAKLGNAVMLAVGSSYAIVNGSRKKIDEKNDDVMPIIKDGRTLVPVRFISESIGASVGWDAAASTVSVKWGDKEVKLALGSTDYYINGQAFRLDVPAQSISGRTFIPLRAVSEALGKRLYWDDNCLIGISDTDNLFNPGTDKEIIDKIVRTFGIYVSPSGNDSGAGTMKQPYATLQRARDALRDMKQKGGLPLGGMTIYLFGGEYSFSDSLSIGELDSGSPDSPVTYRPVPGNTVYFTGAANIPTDRFVPITNEAVKNRLYENVRSKVLQVNLKELGINNFGAIRRSNAFMKEEADSTGLFLDNVQQTLARWPNDGYAKTGNILAQGTGPNDGGAFQYEGATPDRWGKAKEVWLQGYWSVDWYDDSIPVKVIDTKAKSFKLSDKSAFGFAKSKHYFAFNLLEEIDSPGEWYLDRTTGILYYYPPVQFKNNKLQLSLLDKPMLDMNNCSNVNITGIIFEASCGTGISMRNTSDNIVSGCTFRNLGCQAVNIKGGVRCGVLSCDVYDIGKGGVYITGGDRPTLTYGENFVENSYFTRFNLSVKTYAPAISLDGCGNRASHNVIHDGPHSGILMSGNDQLIEYNEIYDLCKESSDAGAVYGGRDWTQQGITFRNNIFHDIYGVDGHGAHAIYFDDSQSGGILESNLFYNCETPIFVHGGRDFNIDSNIIADCTNSVTIINNSGGKKVLDPKGELMQRYNAMPTQSEIWKKKYPTLANLLDDQPEMPKYNKVTRTLNYNTNDFSPVETAKDTGTFEDNITFKDDPGFVDASKKIFKLKAGFDKIKGFKPIDYDNVGLYIDNYRKSMPQLSDFNIISPKNGSGNTLANKLELRWQPSVGATKYRVLVSEDKNFSKIALDKEANTNTLTVSGLKYGNTKYYWKVEAIRTSVLMPETKENKGGIASFTTMQKEIVNYSDLLSAIESATDLLNSSKTGSGVGEYPEQAKNEFSSAIDDAKLVAASKTATQADVDGEVAKLKDAVIKFNSNIVSGNVDLGTLINDKTNWIASNANFLRASQNKLIFNPEQNGGTVAAYKNILPNYPVWTFKAKFRIESAWQGFGLRATDQLAAAWTSSGSYLIVVKKDQFELQRFNSKNKMIQVVPNNGIIESGKEYKIELGATDIPGGVHLVFKVNGQSIFDYNDTDAYIAEPGFLTLYSSPNCPLEISALGDVPAN